MSLEGKQIDRYAIVRLLGSGGMGDVYLAEDPRIGQQVAIKVIRTELSPYPDEQAVHNAARLFQREAKAIVKLDHPHILPLYDYGEEHVGNAPVIYLVMPYRPEGSLTDWLRHRENSDLLSPQDVAPLVNQAADALHHAHEHQVIHQDVKPSNFLVRSRPDAPSHPDLLLSDFGIARLTTATSSVSQSIRGTPAYMAPEQWEGEPVPATDQYALAVMTYELLTGKLPFQGGPGKMMYHHINTPPPPPSSLNPRLSSDIDIVLLMALVKQPDQRFASIKAFANAFQQAAQSPHMDGIQTIHSSELEEVAQKVISPVAVDDEEEMMAPTLLNSDRQIAGSDSETFVKPGETPASPLTPAVALYQKEPVSGEVVPTVIIGARSQKPGHRPLLVLAMLVLVLMLVGGGLAFALPKFGGSFLSSNVSHTSTNVVVSITPVHRNLSSSFTIAAVTGRYNTARNQVGARLLSATTSAQTQTLNATGKGFSPATYATGLLSIYWESTSSTTVPAGTVYYDFLSGGRTAYFVTDRTVVVNANGATTPAHAQQPGTIGDIPAGPLNERIGIWHISAATPFTGGQDAQNFTAVQQSDIDNAAHSLEQANTPNAQQIIRPLIHANERLIGAPACNPNVTSDHNAGDRATTVTVSVNYICTGEAYDYDGARAMGTQLLNNQANTQLGSGYAPVGNIQTTLTGATLTDAKKGTVTLMIDAEGVWAYQFTDAQKQALVKLIAGKTKSEAQTLLASQAGVGQVVITLPNGNGDTLPTDVNKITIVIQNASG